MRYHIWSHMAGYLPESEPDIVTGKAAAKDALAERVEQHRDAGFVVKGSLKAEFYEYGWERSNLFGLIYIEDCEGSQCATCARAAEEGWL